MTETILTLAIVTLVALLAARSIYRTLTGKNDGCGCGQSCNCTANNSCGCRANCGDREKGNFQ